MKFSKKELTYFTLQYFDIFKLSIKTKVDASVRYRFSTCRTLQLIINQNIMIFKLKFCTKLYEM